MQTVKCHRLLAGLALALAIHVPTARPQVNGLGGDDAFPDGKPKPPPPAPTNEASPFAPGAIFRAAPEIVAVRPTDQPSYVHGILSHKPISTPIVTLVLLPFTAATRQALSSELGPVLVRLTMEYQRDASPVRYARMPVIHGYGREMTATSTPSDKDIARARKKADLGAKAAFKAFLDRMPARTTRCENGQRFVFNNVPPGPYILYALADTRIEGSNRGGGQPNLALWWAPLAVRAAEATELALTGDDVLDWQNVFRLAR